MAENEQHPQDVLRGEILADAQRQADRALQRARKEAAGIAEAAEAELEEWRTQQLDIARAEAQRRSNMILASLPVEIGRMRANGLESALQSIYDEVRQQLMACDGLDYRQTLINLSAEAIRTMTGSGFTITLPEADRKLLGEAEVESIKRLANRPDVKLTLVFDPESMDAGPVVHTDDGDEYWDNRLAEKLERLWPMLRREIAVQAALIETVDARSGMS